MTLSILMLDKCRFASDCYAECCGRHYLTISISSPAISSARGKYHCTVDLLFERFGISCMATDNFLFLFAKQTNPKPVKQEVNGTVILPPLIFPASADA
jgi:hypothetical protein